MLFVWEKAPRLQLILLIWPILHFLHLQMMPGDTFLQANQLLKTLSALPHDVSLEVEPLAWSLERRSLQKAFNFYRRSARRLRRMLRNVRLALEEHALELLSNSVRQAISRIDFLDLEWSSAGVKERNQMISSEIH